jgi:ABC-2 type transport system permease protein
MRRTRLLTVARASVVVGVQDVLVEYTWFTWTMGWLTRVILQVVFFALLGRYVGGAEQTWFLLLGGASSVAALEALTVVLYTAFDRWGGVLPLLVAAPGNYFVVLVFRNLNCIVTGTVTSSVALLSCPLLVGFRLDYPKALLAVPILTLGAITTYLFGCFLSGIIIKVMNGRWLLLNVNYMAMVMLCGFTVRGDYWPEPLRWLAQVLPFTHALQALRGLLGDATAAFVVNHCALEAALAVLWFVVGRFVFAVAIERARRDGSIQLNS